MHTDPRTTRAQKRRLAGALLAMSIAAGVTVVADADGVSAATSNPSTRCQTSSNYNFNTNSWYTTRSVYFDPNISVSMFFDGVYHSERVEYTAWLVKWDGKRWQWYRDSQGSYKSVSGYKDFQSGDFPRAVTGVPAGHYNWYVYYKHYGIDASHPQPAEGYANNWCTV